MPIVVQTINRLPSSILNDQTQYEQLFGTSPTNSQLKMYGSSTLSCSNLSNKLNYNHNLASTSSLDMVLSITVTSVIKVLFP